MARPREQELKSRDVPPVRALHEHAPCDQRTTECPQLSPCTGAELAGHGKPHQVLERAQPLRRHRAGDAVDLPEVHPFRAQRDLKARDLGIGGREGGRCGEEAADDHRRDEDAQAHGTDHLAAGGPLPARLYKFTKRSERCLRLRSPVTPLRMADHAPAASSDSRFVFRSFPRVSRADAAGGRSVDQRC